MALTVLIDTNVLLDDLLIREPHAEDSRRVVNECRSGRLIGVIAAHSVSNMFYIMRKTHTVEERRMLLRALCDMFLVEGIDREKLCGALEDDAFPDFEDSLQEKCAVARAADYLVTWNVRDFAASQVPVLTPSELLKLLE